MVIDILNMSGVVLHTKICFHLEEISTWMERVSDGIISGEEVAEEVPVNIFICTGYGRDGVRNWIQKFWKVLFFD